MRVSGGDLCTLVQKHRPSREARRWVQLVALRGIGKTARTSSPCRFWRFSPFARGQYPRTAPARKIRNLSHFLEVLQRVEKISLRIRPHSPSYAKCFERRRFPQTYQSFLPYFSYLLQIQALYKSEEYKQLRLK